MVKKSCLKSGLLGPTLRVPEFSDTVLKHILEETKRVEKAIGCHVIVFHNPFLSRIRGSGTTVSLMVYLGSASQNDFNPQGLLDAISDLFYENPKYWDWDLSHLSEDGLENWFKRFSDNPEDLPFESMFNGSLFISPVLWGYEIMNHLREQAKDFFGPDIIYRWVKLSKSKWLARMERLGPATQQARQRAKLLNPLELAELRALVVHVKRECNAGIYTHLVALDGSGRPIGKVLEWLFGKTIKIFYMDPHSINANRNYNAIQWRQAVLRFSEELPELYYAIREKPDKILFFDDQIANRFTVEAINHLVMLISGGKASHFMTISKYDGNPLSWNRRQDLQGIKLIDNSFVAQDAPTPQSDEFYKELLEHVNSWGLN